MMYRNYIKSAWQPVPPDSLSDHKGSVLLSIEQSANGAEVEFENLTFVGGETLFKKQKLPELVVGRESGQSATLARAAEMEQAYEKAKLSLRYLEICAFEEFNTPHPFFDDGKYISRFFYINCAVFLLFIALFAVVYNKALI